jgi:amidase
VRKAALWLNEAGYVVEEVEPPAIMEGRRIWLEITAVEMRRLTIPAVEPFASPDALKFLRYWAEVFPDRGFMPYVQGLAQRNAVARQWQVFMAEYPLVLGPVITEGTPLANFDIADVESARKFLISSRLVFTANLLGLPAAVVPVGLAKGLPQSAQIIGPRFREDLCFDAAEAIEKRAGVFTPIDPVG